MSISNVESAGNIQMDYMKLLVTQLQNQNPLEPLDNNEMASQLAQFSELSQLETMNSSFAEALITAERSFASSLIGKEVSFQTYSQDGLPETTNAIVEQVNSGSEDEILLSAASYTISLDDVLTIKE